MCKEAAESLLQQLRELAPKIESLLNSPSGEWSARGVIDQQQTIYPLSYDTKLISKVIELMILPTLREFAAQYGYRTEIAPEQNYYPDLTFIDQAECKFALDIKTTYRIESKEGEVSAMTLGTFTGYFRNRESRKNILYPYKEYSGHFVLGIIYTRADIHQENLKPIPIDALETVRAVIRDIRVFVEHKYKIASDRPGSGNTKNIGSVRQIELLLKGEGPFAEHGEEVFDEYWMNYQTVEMAKGSKVPYTNLQEFLVWRSNR
ncbi:MAG: hypothetical protein KatS3mg019_0093 [Fimbriimonadales bacterium]|nr:MAG: hypothetical protein KatS3mg019_0093 [Fimbriimonadales bacterium]